MNLIKTIIKVFVFLLLVSARTCKEKYPELGEGLYAELITTKDTIVVELNYKKVPLTVSNFIGLSEGTHPMLVDSLKGKPYYNGTIFHRVINKFMIQGGDPSGTGSGSPGYKFEDEFNDSLSHNQAGILSMANSGPSTNGSQFFITDAPTLHLDNKHSVFGKVVKGIKVVEAISSVEVAPGSNKPLEDIIILELNIVRQGDDAKKFDNVSKWNKELQLSQERKMKILEKTKKIIKEMKTVLNDYKNKASKLNSGLLIHTISSTKGIKPRTGSKVKLNYEGYFTDGKLFGTNVKTIDQKYGSYDHRKDTQGAYSPISMPLDDEAKMIPGFKEGVFRMSLGDKTFLYLPSHIAYGEEGRGKIKPNTDLIFIIEMLEIIN
mgnify:FL=1